MTMININIVIKGDKPSFMASLYPQSIHFVSISGGYIYTDGFAQFTHFVSDEDFDDKMAAMQDVGWHFTEWTE